MKMTIIFAIALVCSAGAQAGEQAVDDLIPRLASPNVRERTAPQNELHEMAAKASRPGAEAERSELARILAAKAADASVPQPARVWIVRQLEEIGAVESVPSLTSLLNGEDAELRECARRALQVNSAAEASRSLREALAKGGDPSWRVGLISALGYREDAAAASLISKGLDDAATASAAARALARIGTESAIEALWKAADRNVPGTEQALVDAASRDVTKGGRKAAEEICVRLLKRDLPAPVKGSALVVLAQAAPAQAKPAIRDALTGSDLRVQTAAISAARLAFGKSMSATLAEWYPKFSPSVKLLALREFDATSERIVIGALADPDEPVRLLALETLGRIGSAASVPVLVKSAADSPAPVQKIAGVALAGISGPGADATLQKLAGRGDPAFRAAAIRALGDRVQISAIPVLLKYASETNALVSGASCASLGKLGSEAEVEAVARLAMGGGAPEAGAALESILGRIENKDAAGVKLAALSKDANSAQMTVLLGAMTMLGGKTAMEVVVEKTTSPDAAVRDAAIRALASWPDFAAVKSLLEIAGRPDTTRVHQVLALRGVARLAGSAEQEPPANRIAAAKSVIKAAQRNEEKQEAIAALGAIVSPESATALKALLAEPDLKSDAAQAAINLAQRLRRGNRQAVEDLIKAVEAADLPPEVKQKAATALRR